MKPFFDKIHELNLFLIPERNFDTALLLAEMFARTVQSDRGGGRRLAIIVVKLALNAKFAVPNLVDSKLCDHSTKTLQCRVATMITHTKSAQVSGQSN